jgi:hypothetical protein
MWLAFEARTNPAVLPNVGSDQRLSSSPFGRGASSSSALLAFVPLATVIARSGRRVRLDPLAVWTDAAHRYFPPLEGTVHFPLRLGSKDAGNRAGRGPVARSAGSPTTLLRPIAAPLGATKLPPIADLSTCDSIARSTSRLRVRSPASASAATASARAGGTLAAIVTFRAWFASLTLLTSCLYARYDPEM